MVMIVSGDRARQVAVEVGVREGDRVQITKGLSGGETVIVNGAYGLPDNTQVKVAAAICSPAPSRQGAELSLRDKAEILDRRRAHHRSDRRALLVHAVFQVAHLPHPHAGRCRRVSRVHHSDLGLPAPPIFRAW